MTIGTSIVQPVFDMHSAEKSGKELRGTIVACNSYSEHS